ncbi:MAG: ABC transporter permease [Anaerocolumna sp.]
MTETTELQKKPSMKEFLLKNFSFVVIILLIIIFTVLEPNFLNSVNVVNLLSDSTPLMIMAIGMTPVLILGSIDLSIGAMCSVANVLVLYLIVHLTNESSNLFIAVLISFLLTMLTGIASGVILGFIHVKLKVPSFIASLAFMSVWGSVALLITDAPISMPKQSQHCIEWYKIHVGPIGLPLIITILLSLILYFIITRTAFGRGVYAIGGNERAARIAGIKVDKYKIIVFAINGLCAATGAIFLMAKGKSAAPTAGDTFTLLVISAVVLGGTSLIGGKGNILKTILGVFIVAIIKNGMNIIGVNIFWQKIVYGVIVLIAVAVSVDRTSRSAVVK